MALKITRCPTCDGTRMRRVRKTVRRTWKEQAYVVPNLEFEECPDCGELVPLGSDHAKYS